MNILLPYEIIEKISVTEKNSLYYGKRLSDNRLVILEILNSEDAEYKVWGIYDGRAENQLRSGKTPAKCDAEPSTQHYDNKYNQALNLFTRCLITLGQDKLRLNSMYIDKRQ